MLLQRSGVRDTVRGSGIAPLLFKFQNRLFKTVFGLGW